MSSLSHRRSWGPHGLTRDHANLSSGPVSLGKQKYPKRAKPAKNPSAVGENVGKEFPWVIRWGRREEGGLPNRSFLSMCIHLRLAWLVSRV